MPAALVVTVAGLVGHRGPPPPETVKVTATPLTGEPPASVTFTLGGALTGVPAVAACVVAELAAIAVAVPTTTDSDAYPTRFSLVARCSPCPATPLSPGRLPTRWRPRCSNSSTPRRVR